jgi:hypothetical protein
MAFWCLNIAAFIAAVGAVFHGYVGGRIYLGHINGSDLEDLTKSLSVVSWQVFTIWLGVSAGVLVCVSLDASLALMAYPIIAVNALCALLFVYLGVTGARTATEVTRCLPHGRNRVLGVSRGRMSL